MANSVGKRMMPALSMGSWLYLFVCLVLGVWVAVPFLFLGWRPVVLSSGSMEPQLSRGDVLLLREPGSEPVGPGSVVTFADATSRGGLVAHRVQQINADSTYRTKGDANPDPDRRPLAHDDVRGVGRLLVPVVGLPLVWARESKFVHLAAFGAATAVAVALALTSTRHRTASPWDDPLVRPWKAGPS